MQNLQINIIPFNNPKQEFKFGFIKEKKPGYFPLPKWVYPKYLWENYEDELQNIERVFGQPLEWEELKEHKMSRNKYERNGVNLYNKEDWDKMSGFLVKYLPKFESALQPYIKKLK